MQVTSLSQPRDALALRSSLGIWKRERPFTSRMLGKFQDKARRMSFRSKKRA